MPTKPLAISRPEANEHLPHYEKYISLVAGDGVMVALEAQIEPTIELLRGVTEAKSEYRYAPEKWSIKESLGHVIDTERIMAYRALRLARNDRTPLEGFDQDDYVRAAPCAHCEFKDLMDEFACVRESTIFLFRHLDEAAWMRHGIANKGEVTVRALAYIIAGHELHHRQIWIEKYQV